MLAPGLLPFFAIARGGRPAEPSEPSVQSPAALFSWLRWPNALLRFVRWLGR